MAEPRVALRPLTPAHADRIFDEVRDPSLYVHLDEAPPESVEALRERYRFLATGAPPESGEVWLNFVVEHDGHDVGTVQATIPTDGPASIAYVILSAWQGNGLAIAATRELLDELRRRGVGKVQAEIAPANAASLAVARRLGFRPAGRSDDDLILCRSLS